MTTRPEVGFYGVGHFGYALLRLLAPKAGGDIALRAYDRDAEVRESLERRRSHPYHHAGSSLAGQVRIVHDAEALLRDLDVLVLAVTSNATREVSGEVAAVTWTRPLLAVNTAKALDYLTGRRLSEIVREVIPNPSRPLTLAALAGGTIADDVLQGQPLGMTIACERRSDLGLLHRIFGSPQMWVQTTTDLVGLEYSGAFKNVIAICAGMVSGLGFGLGAETHLISRMAGEVEDFCVRRRGAQPATFSVGSQCWGSDLWMSCAGPTRNRALGNLLGKGMSLEEANAQMAAQRKTVEGVQTLRAMRSLLEAHPGDLPLMRAAERVVLHAAPPESLMKALMESERAAPASA